MIYWFTGQPGHGKTTLAKAMLAHLKASGVEAFHIDGDDLRSLTTNEDYSREGREENIRRAQAIAHYLQAKGHTVVVSLVAPYRDLREEFKAVAEVTEIYVHTSQTRGREAKHAEDYQPPLSNFIDVDTTNKTVEESLDDVLSSLSLLSERR
ncbi:MAG: adenylyl-sulfate kinase [Bacteroidetes bacterium]|nr:adenylyl-sulfate kinase [Bacteroidota bacterium]MDA0904557.1 adenylyl-sulfate kinase [Bacteroidota bacterium]MDA1242635.1 adenylyl-sulfate kinase [Bacteroidota bacterium]